MEKNKYLTEDEIVEDFIINMDYRDIEYLRSIPKSKMISFHLNVGMFIRNHYLLWDKNNPLIGQWHKHRENDGQLFINSGIDCHPCHPDAVSGRILDKVWDKINNVS